MSSYLNFYLVPKQKEESVEESKPLLFNNYSRSTDVYKYFTEVLNIPFIGDGEEPECIKLLSNDVQKVLTKAKSDLFERKEILEIKVDAYRAFSIPDSLETAVSEYIEDKNSISELQKTIYQIEEIESMVERVWLDCTDFKEVLINFD